MKLHKMNSIVWCVVITLAFIYAMLPERAYALGNVETLASSLNEPRGIDIDNLGDIYFTDRDGVYRMDADGQNLTLLTEVDTWNWGIEVTNTNIFFTSQGYNALWTMTKAGGSPVQLNTFTGLPSSITLGENCIYMCINSAIMKLNMDGSRIGQVGSGFNYPYGITHDGATLFIADTGNGSIKRMLTGDDPPELVKSGFRYPYGVATDNSYLYVADGGADKVYKMLRTDVNNIEELAPGSFSGPADLALAANGDIYVADTYNDSIKVIRMSLPKTIPVQNTAVVATMVYAGQTLANSNLSGTFKVSASDATPVPGTLEWVDPTSVVNTSGQFAWRFSPTDTAKFSPVSGTVTVTVAPSEISSLSNLAVSSGELSPAFNSDTYTYTASVANTVESVTVTPTSADSTATISVNDVPVASGATSGSIPLALGPNTINIRVTAQSGAFTEYTINVTRIPSIDSSLSNLAVSSGELSPAFNSDTYTYTASVANTVESVTVTPTSADSTATISVNDVPVASGATSGSIPLALGPNTINIRVTAQSGAFTEYTINVTRIPSIDSSLSNLAVSSGELSPAFNSDTYTYTASVANTVESVTVTPTSADSTATISVNDVPVASGAASGSIPLALGPNTINIRVTAQSGAFTEYTINVTRIPSVDSSLSNLAVSSGELSPAFNSDTYTYTASVANTVESVTVTPTSADNNATISVNEVPVASGAASGSIPLALGPNTINIRVTAQSGAFTEYTINVTRIPSIDSSLSNLAVSSGELSPAFNSDTYTYTASVANTVESVTVIPTSADSTATISVNDVPVASGAATGSIPLALGPNTINIRVTAQSGAFTEYSVNITRLPSDENVSGIEEKVADLITFFEDEVAARHLVGVGAKGKSDPNRLKAFSNMLAVAQRQIALGNYEGALLQLQSAYAKVDGQPNPLDFVSGDSRQALADKIMELIELLEDLI